MEISNFMFIVLISRGVPSRRDPQWGCFEKDQAEALTNLGHKVVVISVDSRFRTYWRKIGMTHHRINDIDYFDYFLVPGVITRNFFGLRFNFFVKRKLLQKLFERVVCEHGMPDLLYSHYLPNSYLALSLKEKYHLPLVAIEHWSQLDRDILSDYVIGLGQVTYAKCDAVISVSESLRQRLLQHFQQDSFVVHNMVGSEFCRCLSMGSRDDKVQFVSTGSLIYGKGYDLLIKAFERLKLPKDKWKLLIIGEGQERANLQTQIDRAGLGGNIHLTGKKDKQEIVEILSQSDVFVLPSRSETFGVVYIEAMAMGLPVIATACGGPEDFVLPSDGLLIPVEDVDSLSKAIHEMYLYHDRYDHRKIAQECRARFSPEVIARQLTEVFKTVLNRKK